MESTSQPLKTWKPITEKKQEKQWQTKPSRKIVKNWVTTRSVGTNNQVNIQEFVPLLEAAFQRDMTVVEACDYAKLPRQTFYRYLKNDAEFAAKMETAKRLILLRSKQRSFDIIDKGSDRDAGPMIRWLLEKRQPEIYAPTPLQVASQTQNNFFIINNEELSVLTKQSDIASSDPSELLEALEAAPIVDTRPKEEGASSIHTEAS